MPGLEGACVSSVHSPGLRGEGKRGPGCSHFLATTLHGGGGHPSMWWAASCLLPPEQSSSPDLLVSVRLPDPYPLSPGLPDLSGATTVCPLSLGSCSLCACRHRPVPPLPCRCPLCPCPGLTLRKGVKSQTQWVVLRMAGFHCRARLLGPQGPP